MADPTFVAYIDESGCDGDDFDNGSSEFLILSAAVGFEALTPDIDLQVDIIRNVANKPSGWTPPKFSIGYKFWPSEAESLYFTDDRFGWMRGG